ncbi:hypothetical protein T492DRAFT_1136188, partial [Pavlovales sp. CCMP2436]
GGGGGGGGGGGKRSQRVRAQAAKASALSPCVEKRRVFPRVCVTAAQCVAGLLSHTLQRGRARVAIYLDHRAVRNAQRIFSSLHELPRLPQLIPLLRRPLGTRAVVEPKCVPFRLRRGKVPPKLPGRASRVRRGTARARPIGGLDDAHGTEPLAQLCGHHRLHRRLPFLDRACCGRCRCGHSRWDAASCGGCLRRAVGHLEHDEDVGGERAYHIAGDSLEVLRHSRVGLFIGAGEPREEHAHGARLAAVCRGAAAPRGRVARHDTASIGRSERAREAELGAAAPRAGDRAGGRKQQEAQPRHAAPSRTGQRASWTKRTDTSLGCGPAAAGRREQRSCGRRCAI